MKRKSIGVIAIVGVFLSVLMTLAMAAQDKYTVKVPGGLAFSEFKGYEAWQAISISRNEKVVAMILGNPAMIEPVFHSYVDSVWSTERPCAE